MHGGFHTELKTLRKELRQRSDAAVKQILKSADVILSTLTSATDEGPLRILDEMHFDVVVIDECSQVSYYQSVSEHSTMACQCAFINLVV